MLDFGTDLDQRADAAPEDDLFAGNVTDYCILPRNLLCFEQLSGIFP